MSNEHILIPASNINTHVLSSVNISDEQFAIPARNDDSCVLASGEMSNEHILIPTSNVDTHVLSSVDISDEQFAIPARNDDSCVLSSGEMSNEQILIPASNIDTHVLSSVNISDEQFAVPARNDDSCVLSSGEMCNEHILIPTSNVDTHVISSSDMADENCPITANTQDTDKADDRAFSGGDMCETTLVHLNSTAENLSSHEAFSKPFNDGVPVKDNPIIPQYFKHIDMAGVSYPTVTVLVADNSESSHLTTTQSRNVQLGVSSQETSGSKMNYLDESSEDELSLLYSSDSYKIGSDELETSESNFDEPIYNRKRKKEIDITTAATSNVKKFLKSNTNEKVKNNNARIDCKQSTHSPEFREEIASSSKANIRTASKMGRKKKQEVNLVSSSDASDCSDPERIGNVPMRKRKGGNNRNKRKENIDKGEPYISSKGFPVHGKSVKPNPCHKCRLHCASISEATQHEIFSTYYSTLTRQQQRDWLRSHSTKIPVSRRTTGRPSGRNFTYRYHIEIDGKVVYVCLQFLMATLGISKKLLQYSLQNMSILKTAKPDQRGKAPSCMKTPDSASKEVEIFIKDLPAVPSHYNRANSNKRYLPANLNRRLVYEDYKKYLTEKGKSNFVSLQVFKKIFNKFNIGFHKPKKDKCVTCEEMRNRNKSFGLSEEDKIRFQAHKKEKKATYREYKNDIEKAKSSENLIVASFDLQRVLVNPHSESTLMYYSRKYAYYNLTIYENKTHDGMCYLWGECDGKKGSLEIATCVQLWLEGIN
ncbi:uncharacterized protein LOC134542350 [Bacillus rossius redtenbacheri]|uniref:uncharacterized protein LOC134542350 n=1 Tax=Bacillus rossius redtenbacheri TaxID=93214 RepID=UPI002FDDB629